MKRPLDALLRHHATGAIERGEAEAVVERISERDLILQALAVFVRSRPGFEPGNYATRTDYQRDVARAYRQMKDAQEMLRAVQWRASLDGDALKRALSDAFSGRLTWKLANDGRSGMLDYCTGQYYPTEFRAAVCAVLSQALWTYFRDNVLEHIKKYPSYGRAAKEDKYDVRRFILTDAKRELSRGVFTRWFKNS